MGAPRMFGYLESFRAEPTSLHTLLRLWLSLQAGEVDGRRDNLDDCLVQDSKVASESWHASLFAICALGALSARLGWFFRVMPAVLIRYLRTRNQVATKEVQPLRSDLARLAKQYVVEHSPSMGSQQKDHAKSFCAVVLYPFEPKLPVEPAERFVKLSVGQLVEVTHETRNGWYFGYLLSDPNHAGYLPKSHVVSFSGFCQMQKMYYSDQADKF